MNLEDKKRTILKAFSEIIKEGNRKGPKNIYIKNKNETLNIYLEGINSTSEIYLIKTFGQEAIDVFQSFYERDAYITEKKFKELLDFECEYDFYKLECDFINDKFVYKMKKRK